MAILRSQLLIFDAYLVLHGMMEYFCIWNIGHAITCQEHSQLAVKAGRDGKNGEKGTPGEPGKPGRDGKDFKF